MSSPANKKNNSASLQKGELGSCPDFPLPKFHAIAHNTPCILNYDIACRQGIFHTDGEAIERAWAFVGTSMPKRQQRKRFGVAVVAVRFSFIISVRSILMDYRRLNPNSGPHLLPVHCPCTTRPYLVT
ncbi:hypothetical protein DFH06DRAFT_1341781 [Mycena polygramma]|nr:hypothetical protein DFH06DRAFT_1341781 [Mycena polygramma]